MSARIAPTRRMTAAGLGKIPTTRDRRLISLLIRSSGLVDQVFCQWALGKVVNASTSGLASSISGPIFGNVVARGVADLVPGRGDRRGVGLSEDHAENA